jgi:Erythromycin esterase homolog
MPYADERGTDRLMPDDVQVIGLGEATHGSRELFKFKAWLVRRLVTNTDCQTVLFEADAADFAEVGARVFSGTGSLASALAGVAHWRYRTETICELLSWLQSYNADRPPAERVRVRGIDLPAPSGPAAHLKTYLELVDSAYLKSTDAVVTLTQPVPADPEHRSRVLDTMTEAARSLAIRLDTQRSAYVAASSEPQWREARYLCGVAVQTCAWHRVRHNQPGPHAAGMRVRDRGMAENVSWCVAHQSPVVVWAHNAHVKRGRFEANRPWSGAATMGDQLAQRFGDTYCPIGTDFGRGQFRAVNACDGSDTPTTFQVGEPPAGSTTAWLDTHDAQSILLSLQNPPPEATGPGRLRHVGSVYDPTADPSWALLQTTVPASFDAIGYVTRSTPSRSIDQ